MGHATLYSSKMHEHPGREIATGLFWKVNYGMLGAEGMESSPVLVVILHHPTNSTYIMYDILYVGMLVYVGISKRADKPEHSA